MELLLPGGHAAHRAASSALQTGSGLARARSLAVLARSEELDRVAKPLVTHYKLCVGCREWLPASRLMTLMVNRFPQDEAVRAEMLLLLEEACQPKAAGADGVSQRTGRHTDTQTPRSHPPTPGRGGGDSLFDTLADETQHAILLALCQEVPGLCSTTVAARPAVFTGTGEPMANRLRSTPAGVAALGNRFLPVVLEQVESGRLRVAPELLVAWVVDAMQAFARDCLWNKATVLGLLFLRADGCAVETCVPPTPQRRRPSGYAGSVAFPRGSTLMRQRGGTGRAEWSTRAKPSYIALVCAAVQRPWPRFCRGSRTGGPTVKTPLAIQGLTSEGIFCSSW